jgi:hypothetical protein
MRARLIWSAVIGGILAFSLILGSINQSLAGDAGPGIYFSLVKKGSVNRYLNRLADDSFHFVATKNPVPAAVASAILFPNSGEQLVVAEIHRDTPTRLRGELRRFGNFAVLSLPYSTDLHLIDDQQTVYGEAVSEQEEESPASQGTTVRVSSFDFAASRDFKAPSVVIDQAYLLDRLRTFSGEQKAVVGGREVLIRERRQGDMKQYARDWLRQEYEALGYTVREESYDGLSFTGSANFVAEKVGEDPGRVLVLSSHLDSVGNAGADDNASGTIAALAIAKALKDLPLKVTLRVVAFDEEEIGLVGSRAYVSSLRSRGELAQLIGAINLEMLAYQSRDDGAFHVIDCEENESDRLAQVFRQIAAADGELGLRPERACTNRSDHASFWRAGIPAVVVSENFFGGDGNPCYHRSCDQFNRINISYLTRMTSLVARAVATLTSR